MCSLFSFYEGMHVTESRATPILQGGKSKTSVLQKYREVHKVQKSAFSPLTYCVNLTLSYVLSVRMCMRKQRRGAIGYEGGSKTNIIPIMTEHFFSLYNLDANWLHFHTSNVVNRTKTTCYFDNGC
jgi:hypothetical protein